MPANKRKGLIHVYTGAGKGKTSISLGLALRSMGHGFSVYMIQLLKGGSHMGEVISSIEILPRMTIKQYGKKCPYSDEMKKGDIDCGNCRDCFISRNEEREYVEEALNHAEKILKSGKYDLVIIDEVNNALHRKLTSVDRVLKLIKSKKSHTELVLTGRNAPKRIIEAADYVTELKDVKHPFNRGIRVRRGIDY
ncbi:MAG: cob(I)yrinic acid a,c-diamide adenosyltransferase [Candidatus Altiarchaeota archaeon]